MTLSKQEVEFLHDLLRCIETLDVECRMQAKTQRGDDADGME